MKRWRASGSPAFTFIELLACLAILGFLVSVTALSWPKLMASAASVRCLGNMRSLHVSLGSYVHDVGHWPQIPEGIDTAAAGGDDSTYEDWWLNELKNYGGTPEVWQCPTIQRLVAQKAKDGRPKLHYVPTPFDAQSITPYRWSTQPWLIEIGNMHGRGAHICFPDGSIRTMDDILKGG